MEQRCRHLPARPLPLAVAWGRDLGTLLAEPLTPRGTLMSVRVPREQ